VNTVAAEELAQTYLPDESDNAGEVLSFLDAHDLKHVRSVKPRYFLAGTDEHDNVEISETVHQLLRQVLEAMAKGKAVTVVPQSQQLTTQQAADLLGVSRPTVIRIIEAGDIPATKIGKHRKLLLSDVLEFQKRRRDAIFDFLADTSVDDDDPAAIALLLKEARKVVGSRYVKA